MGGRLKRLLACLALVGCGPATHVGVGYAVSNGAAMLPPTGTRGTTAMLTYHEEGGPVARLIVTAMIAMGMEDPYKNVHTSTKVETDRVGNTIYEKTTTTTTITPTSAAEQAAREARNAERMAAIPGILNDSGFPFTVDFGLARESFGGDTHATSFDFGYHVGLGDRTDLGIGMGFRSFTFNHRTVTRVSADGGAIMSAKSMDPVDYNYVGFPLKLTQGILPRTALFVEIDLNLLVLTEDYADNHPSLYTLGLEYQIPFLRVRGTVMASGFDAGSLSYGLEGIIGF